MTLWKMGDWGGPHKPHTWFQWKTSNVGPYIVSTSLFWAVSFTNKQFCLRKKFFFRMCGGPLKCGGPCSAEHVRTLVNPALTAHSLNRALSPNRVAASPPSLRHCQLSTRHVLRRKTHSHVTNKALVANTIPLRFDCNSTALRPLDNLRYDRRPTCCGLQHWGLNKQISVIAASGLRQCDLNDLWWVVEWTSNGRRIEVES